MVNEGIKNGIYKETTDTTLHDLKLIQDFLTVILNIIKITKI